MKPPGISFYISQSEVIKLLNPNMYRNMVLIDGSTDFEYSKVITGESNLQKYKTEMGEFPEIEELAKRIIEINEEAYYAYKPLVEQLCHKTEATENEVCLMLDYLLQFCGSDKNLELYKKVCRSFYETYPEAIVQYINFYREEYESE